MTSEHVIQVVAKTGSKRERVVLECPLDEGTLPLLNEKSPLSAAIVSGGGMEYIPRAVSVYVDGKLRWTRRCFVCGETALQPTTRSMIAQPSITAGLELPREMKDEIRARERALDRLAYDQYRAARQAENERACDSVVSVEVASEVAGRLEAGPARPAVATGLQAVAARQVTGMDHEGWSKTWASKMVRTSTGVPDPAWCRKHYPKGYERKMLNGYVCRWFGGEGADEDTVAPKPVK